MPIISIQNVHPRVQLLDEVKAFRLRVYKLLRCLCRRVVHQGVAMWFFIFTSLLGRGAILLPSVHGNISLCSENHANILQQEKQT